MTGAPLTVPAGVFRDQAIPDPGAVFSVLQFGAIVPPLSPWQGHSTGTQAIRPSPSHPGTGIVDRLDQVLEERLDGEPDPILLFSGGVDSSLIAARLAKMGRRNTLLVNFSFGTGDREAEHAERIAGHLGLPYWQVEQQYATCAVLEAPGQVYRQPFADHSTFASWDMAKTIISAHGQAGRLIIDGTGADGGFGLANRVRAFRRLARIPFPAGVPELYGRKRLWREISRKERTLRVIRRARTMPLVAALVAQNPLAGIFYDQAPAEAVYDHLGRLVDEIAGPDIVARIVAADLEVTCARVFAQKGLDVYRAAGLDVFFPFLEPVIVGYALATASRQQGTKEELKQVLTDHLPAELVYRPKSGFTDPARRVFRSAFFLDHLAEAISDDLLGLRPEPVVECMRILRGGHALPEQTLNCLWAIAFLSRWYRTAAGAGAPDQDACRPTG